MERLYRKFKNLSTRQDSYLPIVRFMSRVPTFTRASDAQSFAVQARANEALRRPLWEALSEQMKLLAEFYKNGQAGIEQEPAGEEQIAEAVAASD